MTASSHGQQAPRPVRVAILSRYSSAGPSSRYRFSQFLPHLGAHGIEVDWSPLLDDDYVEDLYAGRTAKGPGRLTSAVLRRLGALARVRRYDVAWVAGELFPFAPAFFEQALALLGVPYVVDYDDALFHRYDQHPSAWVRALLGRKIDRVMAAARIVVAGNAYLAERARNAGARDVRIIPTVIDLDKYPADPPAAPERFTIGWIGSPMTQHYLASVGPALSELAAEDPSVRIVAVGAREDFRVEGVPIERIRWSDATEVEEMRRFSVGVMPLVDDPWERGKCGFKLIQYMGCHLPVVASPVGVNQVIVTPGHNGFLAQGVSEWQTALRTLKSDPALAARMGAAGRRRVEEGYAVSVAVPRIAAALRDAAHGARR